jgi:HEAT repeat protein
VAIKASSAREVDALVADLTGSSAVARDAATARLTVIGARAVGRLTMVAESNEEPAARVAALKALEGIADARALDTALRLTRDPQTSVAAAAVSLARVFIRHEKGTVAVDRLTAAALDDTLPEEIRAAAVRALEDLEPATIAPLLKSLSSDASDLVRAEAASLRDTRPAPVPGPDASLARAADEGLPDHAEALRQLLVLGGEAVPLPVLLRLVERVRERESMEPVRSRAPWAAVRALAHLVLARRHSRVALYDLREMLEQSGQPLPVDALAALSLIGDVSCLEAIASSYARTTDAWWKDRLRDVFRAIVERERLTRRHAAVKRVEKKWADALSDLWPERQGHPTKG